MNTILKTMAMAGVALFISAQPVLAQQTERVPALREKVYSQLARAQTVADEQGNAQGIEVLNEVASRADSMNSYERAMLWNFFGFMYYDNGDTAKAIDYFGKVVAEQPIPESLQKSTLFSLAQLALSDGQYDKSLNYLGQWRQLADADELPKAWVLEAQAMYQNGRYQDALEPIQKAIAKAEDEGDVAKENWLILARAIHYELGQTDGVAKMLEKLVVNYSKPEYWLQLAGVYGQLEKNAKQLAVLEAAYQQGFVEKPSELRNLAQVYYLNELPYKAAEIMEQGLSNGKLDNTLSNRKFYAQSLMQAKEFDAAIEAYQQAAELGDRGDMLAQAAQLALNIDRNDVALELAQQALAAGELKNPGNMYLVQGMVHVNQKQYQKAVAAFQSAQDYEATEAAASQWVRYAKSQLEFQQQLANNDI
ncbi:tetratricopeptide repeat protein [Idiomarina sp. OT37-5b]|uniref:tetratricopeptide repeat protein n=1 Tax=Idiomarina sp. OT37-5b TaxID=2100422 RepID=UPI0021CB30E3|nr:tetratricopeptide repeat protein [Idiomarina sp. OT37-5b]